MDNEQFSSELEEKKTVYTGADVIFAWVMFTLGYLTGKMLLEYHAGLGAFITGAVFCAAIPVYLAVKGVKQGIFHILYVLVSASFTSVFFLSDNGVIKALAALYVFGSMIFYIYFTGSTPNSFGSGHAVFDILCAVFAPLSKLGRIFPSAFRFKGKVGKRIGQIALGILLAIIPTVIVLLLLISADKGFENLFEKIFDFENFNFLKEFGFILLGIPLAMYVFGGMFYAARDEKTSLDSEQTSEKVSSFLRFMPPVTAFVSVVPIIVIYIAFTVVQSSYIFGGFASILPEGLTYADYARNGFFELCGVSAFNLLIILCLLIFTKRKDGKKSAVMKTFVIIMSFMTLLLISVAMSKLYMYMEVYGLTTARVYPGWFMLVLAVAFVFIIIKQICGKFNYFLSFFLAFTLLFGGLCFCDVDARIAQYNVWAYTSGKTEQLDVDYILSKLSDSAVPYLIPLLDGEGEEAVAGRIRENSTVKRRILLTEDESFAEWDLPSLKLLKYKNRFLININ